MSLQQEGELRLDFGAGWPRQQHLQEQAPLLVGGILQSHTAATFRLQIGYRGTCSRSLLLETPTDYVPRTGAYPHRIWVTSQQTNAKMAVYATSSTVPQQALYQTYISNNYALQIRQTCASGTVFRVATVRRRHIAALRIGRALSDA